MPELPEVETIARQLNERLSGCKIRGLIIRDAKLLNANIVSGVKALPGAMIRNVSRMGKLAVIHIAPRKGPQLHLRVHLRMTGRLIWSDNGAPPDQRTPRAILQCDCGALYFCDTRRFGVMEICAAEQRCAGGTDPMLAPLDATTLASVIRGSKQEIKPWLMRQDRLCGIGNIYASEILFESGISPFRKAGDLSAEELKKLGRATKAILQRAIRNCGVTFSDFQDSNGRMGKYQKFLKVYARTGKPCPRCGAIIQRSVQQQRSTFFCPICQK